MTIETYNIIVAIFVALGQGVILILLAGKLFPKYLPEKVRGFLSKRGYVVAFVVALLAVVGPLIYSELYNFTPCLICWHTRFVMFPAAFVLLLGTIYRDADVRKYVIPMMLVGVYISARHYLLQMGIIGPEHTTCSAVGQSIDCGTLYVFEFGYITIPLMALTAFILIAMLLWHTKKK